MSAPRQLPVISHRKVETSPTKPAAQICGFDGCREVVVHHKRSRRGTTPSRPREAVCVQLGIDGKTSTWEPLRMCFNSATSHLPSASRTSSISPTANFGVAAGLTTNMVGGCNAVNAANRESRSVNPMPRQRLLEPALSSLCSNGTALNVPVQVL